jgi:hypothetical protein
MAVKSVTYLANQPTTSALGSQNTERGPTEDLWGAPGAPNAWIADFLQSPRLGMYFFDDFKTCGISPATGSAQGFSGEMNYSAYATTGGVIADSAIVGGGINLSGATTAHQGVALGSLTTGFQIVTSTTVYQQRLVFECRVQLSLASLANSKSDVFIGLSDTVPASQVPISNTGGTLSTTPGLIGFHKRGGTTNAADWNFVYQLAGGTAVYPTNLQALVATVLGTAPSTTTLAFYKLGFVYDPFAPPLVISSASTGQTAGNVARPIIRVYVNGVPAAAFLTTTNVGGAAFPVTTLSPNIAFMQQSTTAAVSCDVDWVRVAQQTNA